MTNAQKLSAFLTPAVAERAGVIDRAGGSGPECPGRDLLISGLEYDSRKVQDGSCYFALPGLHADGRAFIPEAVKRGAAAVVYEGERGSFPAGPVYIRVKDARFAMSPIADAYYGSPSRRLGVIGVTGTEGKSTTVYLIWQLLRLLKKKAGFISTVQYSLGSGAEWNSEHQTTPEAVTVQRLLAEMRDHGAEYAVIESSSHGLSPRTNRLGDVAYDAAVMTNVTHEHLEFHGTWEQYRDDKANLFRALGRFSHTKTIGRPGAETAPVEVPAFGVINADDPSAVFFAEAARADAAPETDGFPVFTYSVRGKAAGLSLQSIESFAERNRYRVLDADSNTALEIADRLPGAFNAGNVLAALLTVSRILALPLPEPAALVPLLKPVRGRMTAVNRGQAFEALVDYAHTPSSFSAIFPPLRERLEKQGGRIISLFGSAGERDTAKRSEQGRIAWKWSDIVILTDEDPRGEEPMAILEEIARGIDGNGTDRPSEHEGPRAKIVRRGENLFLIPDRPEAIRRAFSLAAPGDLVLLLGKGHENSIIYAGETRPYDEITEAEKALEELTANQPQTEGWRGITPALSNKDNVEGPIVSATSLPQSTKIRDI
ncbi:MAG: UDP-N-acetylmuramyl-tripeptide synthetase [Treponema sp.]|jgi:UDP-N-acetylmuramoyl-L-alanyl-D-glutamate--2,6-diaminopimelate ligase|nr:UDP-N-acetylmuramyl-tripeptide synthetase [Treponema sp.]